MAKVLAADISDREGGTVLLRPLARKRPCLQLLWVETGSDGAPFQQSVKKHLHVRREVVKHPGPGVRGVWAPEGAAIDWDQVVPKGLPVLPRRWVGERTTVGSLAMVRACIPAVRLFSPWL